MDQIDEIPKVPQLDRGAHDETVTEIRNAIEALQEQVRAVYHEIQGKFSGKDEFLTRKSELIMHLDECSKKLDLLQEQNGASLGSSKDPGLEGRVLESHVHASTPMGRGASRGLAPSSAC